MNDVNSLIYDEVKQLRTDLKQFMVGIDKRVSVLEEFKNKAVGMWMLVGGAIGYAFEYLKGKVM